MKFRKAGILTKIVIAGLLVYAIVGSISLRTQIVKAQEQQEALSIQASQLAAENAEMQYEIDNSTVPDVIESVARNRLGLVKPGEIVFYDASN